MAEPFATATDLADRWRPLSTDEIITASVLLADASDMVRESFPDVEARLAAGTLLPSTLTRIVTGMVKRVMSNVDGKREESIDDYRYVRDVEVASGYLFLSAHDRTALTPLRRRWAFVVDLG